MKKKEAIEKLKHLSPYSPGRIIVDTIYSDKDEVPDDLIELLLNPPKPKPFSIEILTSARGKELFENALKEAFDTDIDKIK